MQYILLTLILSLCSISLSKELNETILFERNGQFTPKASNCYDLYKNGYKSNGVYEIFPVNENESIRVFCEMHNGGWTRVMNKVDLSATAFNKSWQQYTVGFGDVHSNSWLGLENIRQLTNQQRMSIRIEMSNSRYDEYMIEYDLFFIGPASEKFNLTVGKKTFGSADDKFSSQNGAKFSTYDQDNDSDPGSCSNQYNGGWWFKSCYHACLTCQNNRAGHWCPIGCTNSGHFLYFKNIKMLIRPNSNLF